MRDYYQACCLCSAFVMMCNVYKSVGICGRWDSSEGGREGEGVSTWDGGNNNNNSNRDPRTGLTSRDAHVSLDSPLILLFIRVIILESFHWLRCRCWRWSQPGHQYYDVIMMMKIIHQNTFRRRLQMSRVGKLCELQFKWPIAYFGNVTPVRNNGADCHHLLT